MTGGTTVERKSGRELAVTRRFDAPARLVFEAWTKPEIFRRWWVPQSAGLTLLSCQMDIRAGGTYRLIFSHPAAPQPMAFFGRYDDVTPSRLVWTNEEGGADGSVTTVTFEEQDGQALIVLRDLYPSSEALDAAIASGSTCGFDEQFRQLDELLAGTSPART